MRCPFLSKRMLLPVQRKRQARQDLGSINPTALRARYAISGTDLANPAPRPSMSLLNLYQQTSAGTTVLRRATCAVHSVRY
eukprot:3935899-Rhodomonas_salina.1